MNSAARLLPTEHLLDRIDERDALRLFEATMLVAVMPGLISRAARDKAVERMRLMANEHPMHSEVLWTIIDHLEKLP